MFKSIRTWGLGLFAALAMVFTSVSYAEPLVTYLQAGYMYASAEAEFTSELAYFASLQADTGSDPTGGLVRDSHGYLQFSADAVDSYLKT